MLKLWLNIKSFASLGVGRGLNTPRPTLQCTEWDARGAPRVEQLEGGRQGVQSALDSLAEWM